MTHREPPAGEGSPTVDVLTRAVLDSLLDDASMYPPSAAPMEAALGLHATVARSPWAWAQGPFLVPAGALRDLPRERATLGLTDPLDTVVVVGSPADPTGRAAGDLVAIAAAACSSDPGLRLRGVEVRGDEHDMAAIIARGQQLADELGCDQVAIEIPVRARDVDDVEQDVRHVDSARAQDQRIIAKVRCGSTDPSAVPTAVELAAFLYAATQEQLPFKATAGLHHAIADLDLDHPRHGFLNVVAAIERVWDGTRREVAATLAATDVSCAPGLLRVGSSQLDAAAVTRARASLRSIGTCSFTEPIHDLVALTEEATRA